MCISLNVVVGDQQRDEDSLSYHQVTPLSSLTTFFSLSIDMPSVDENTLPPSRHARDISSRPQPIKSNKQRGSILLGKNPDLFTVFEDKTQLSAGRKAAEEDGGKDGFMMGRMRNLEAAVKVLQKKNERTGIDQKTLSDRRKSDEQITLVEADQTVSTTEANFVELKYDLLLSSKPTPSTPARSRNPGHHESPFDSPNACPSLTGAEENTTFASPPVPALARKLLRMSMQGRPSSGLRTELRFDNFSDDSTVLGQDAMEIMQDEDCKNQYHDTKRDAVSSARKLSNPPPTFDPELSLGDMSLIEGISLDAAQADAYLDDISTPNDSCTSRLVNETTDVEEENSLDRVDNHASVSSQTEPPIASVPKACGYSDSTSHLVDATMQTDENLRAYCDMAVQVLVPSEFTAPLSLTMIGPTTFDVGMQTSQGDANKLLASEITDQQAESPSYTVSDTV